GQILSVAFTPTDGVDFNGATLAVTITVNDAPPPPVATNIALNKPVVVSSIEATQYAGANAVDGNGSTRWSSAFSDPQWIYVDLTQTYAIDRVVLRWETAFGADYQVQVSNDATTWTTIRSVTNSDGGVDDLAGLVGTGRYVRVSGTRRGTQWGYSLWELEAYGTPTGPPPPPPAGLPSPWLTADIGGVVTTGSAAFSNGTFTIAGAGADIWGNADAFRYAYQGLSGDGQIVARVTQVQNTNTFAKAGVMLRESTAADSAHVILDVRPDGSLEFMTRSVSGGVTTFIAGGSRTPPQWIMLTRTGGTVTGSASINGSTWTLIGTTTISLASTGTIGLVVTSHDAATINTSTFDNVTVSTAAAPPPPPPPPPPPVAGNVVIYASDIPAASRHGSWSAASDPTSPNGVKLVTSDIGVANTANALASPTDYVDVPFAAAAGTPYTVWLRMKATANSKFNDSAWLQFSDATAGGSSVYPLDSNSGLLVNLATDSSAVSVNGWGWQNAAYWLGQPTTFTFSTGGPHTLRIQVREDGVQFDQIVLSPSQYIATPPGPVTNDFTVVPKP
ncbi:MAG: chitinase, partial [Mycobacterium sp.]|nr:chitinase [Mycobacterium sp.]